MPNFDLWRIKNYSSISHRIPIFISHNIPFFMYIIYDISTIKPYIPPFSYYCCLNVERTFHLAATRRVASLLAIAQLPRGLVELDLVLLRCGIGAKGAKARLFFLAMATVVRLGFFPGFMVDIYGYISYIIIYHWISIVGFMFQTISTKNNISYVYSWMTLDSCCSQVFYLKGRCMPQYATTLYEAQRIVSNVSHRVLCAPAVWKSCQPFKVSGCFVARLIPLSWSGAWINRQLGFPWVFFGKRPWKKWIALTVWVPSCFFPSIFQLCSSHIGHTPGCSGGNVVPCGP